MGINFFIRLTEDSAVDSRQRVSFAFYRHGYSSCGPRRTVRDFIDICVSRSMEAKSCFP
jgi:hypothetical protein